MKKLRIAGPRLHLKCHTSKVVSQLLTSRIPQKDILRSEVQNQVLDLQARDLCPVGITSVNMRGRSVDAGDPQCAKESSRPDTIWQDF